MIFNIFTFIFVMNLFPLFNSFYSHKFIKNMNKVNYKINNRIYMGCDYYIEHNLRIYYNDETYNYINLNRERGYYSDYDDFIMNIRNEASGISRMEKMKQYHLTPRALPFLIYTNNTFINTYVSDQFKEMLEFEIINHDYKTWDDIKEIVILEERYERD